MTTNETLITPEQAGEILAKHYNRVADGQFTQREVKQAVVLRYEADMTNGAWLLTPQTISFDENGDLIDGQHRLEAVRQSGKAQRFLISKGWPAKNGGVGIVDVIDSGKARSVPDMLHMHGTKYASRYYGTVRNLLHIAHGVDGVSASYANTVFVLDKLNIRKAVDEIALRATNVRDLKVPLLGPLAWYWTVKPRNALEFADNFFQCTAEKGSAIQTLLTWMKTKRSQSDARKGMCAAIRGHESETGKLAIIRPNIEAVTWLREQNKQLADTLKKMCPAWR